LSPFLDILLVLLAVALAFGYLIWRKISAARRARRDWASGHSEVCSSCPAITIAKARREKAEKLKV